MIYLVRHGEAAAGWGDHPDPGLSEEGHRQAEAAALKLLEYGAGTAITSPMQRCRETARAFERVRNLNARVEAAVSEIETPSGIADRVAWLRQIMSGHWPASLLSWRTDAFNAVSSLPEGTAVFSHFVAINAIVSHIMEDPRVLVFRPGHCSITVLRKTGVGGLEVAGRGREAETRIL